MFGICIRYKIADTVERNVSKTNSKMSKKSKPTWMAYEAMKAVKANTIAGNDVQGASNITILRISKVSEIMPPNKPCHQISQEGMDDV